MSDETVDTNETGEAFDGIADDNDTGAEGGAGDQNSDAAAGDETGGAFDDAEGNGGDDAGGSEKGAGEGAPETYGDFALPEGFEANEEGMAQFSDEAKSMNLTQEGAQKYLDSLLAWKTREELTRAGAVQARAGFNTQASKAAGLMTPESRQFANAGIKALDHDGSLAPALKEAGLLSHPAIMGVFKSYGQRISQDSDVPNPGSDGGVSLRSAAETLYPEMND